MIHCLHVIPMCLHVHGPIFCILTAVHNPATQNKLTHMPLHISQESACTSDPSNQPSCACRRWSLPSICRAHSLPYCEGAQSPNADKKGADAGNVIRAVAEALQMVIVVGTGQHAQGYGAQHSTAQLPGATVSCALWPSLVISALPGRDPFSNPFQEVMCQVVVCIFLR